MINGRHSCEKAKMRYFRWKMTGLEKASKQCSYKSGLITASESWWSPAPLQWSRLKQIFYSFFTLRMIANLNLKIVRSEMALAVI
jgi:hypothetical protein